jgi:hypothetical protein
MRTGEGPALSEELERGWPDLWIPNSQSGHVAFQQQSHARAWFPSKIACDLPVSSVPWTRTPPPKQTPSPADPQPTTRTRNVTLRDTVTTTGPETSDAGVARLTEGRSAVAVSKAYVVPPTMTTSPGSGGGVCTSRRGMDPRPSPAPRIAKRPAVPANAAAATIPGRWGRRTAALLLAERTLRNRDSPPTARSAGGTTAAAPTVPGGGGRRRSTICPAGRLSRGR